MPGAQTDTSPSTWRLAGRVAITGALLLMWLVSFVVAVGVHAWRHEIARHRCTGDRDLQYGGWLEPDRCDGIPAEPGDVVVVDLPWHQPWTSAVAVGSIAALGVAVAAAGLGWMWGGRPREIAILLLAAPATLCLVVAGYLAVPQL